MPAGPCVILSLQKLLFKRQNAPPRSPPELTPGGPSSIVPQRGESRPAQLMLSRSLHAAGCPDQPPPPLPPLHGRHDCPAAGGCTPAACALQPFKLRSSSNPCQFCRQLYSGGAQCRLRQGLQPQSTDFCRPAPPVPLLPTQAIVSQAENSCGAKASQAQPQAPPTPPPPQQQSAAPADLVSAQATINLMAPRINLMARHANPALASISPA